MPIIFGDDGIMAAEDGGDKNIKSIYGSPDNSPGFLLWQVNNKWQREQHKALKKIGLTHVQFVILAGIAWLTVHGLTVTQAILSDFTKADKMMTSQVVRKLMEKGLISRIRNPDDSRSYSLELTAKGFNLTKMSFGMVESVDKEFFKSLSDMEKENIVRILGKLSSL